MNGKILGVDYGLKRVGLAISDETHSLAFPFKTITASSRKKVIAQLKKIIDEERVSMVVIGLPLTLKGKEGEIAKEVKKFGEELSKEIEIEVRYIDERFTSVEAEKILKSGAKTRRKRRDKRKLDLLSASIILQTYLDMMKKK